MPSLPAPEDTHVQRMQQMHMVVFFRLRICMLLCYIDGAILAIARVAHFAPAHFAKHLEEVTRVEAPGDQIAPMEDPRLRS
ncbi:MAG: hypothetical protein DMG40_05315 [Acidobacteria bacterium]|nr:MAG: hypothetical protein DMG40_05315 [Acidobacteriota bacterium]